MRSLKNLKENGTVLTVQNMNEVKGGKRIYGLVKWGSAAVSQFFSTISPITEFRMVNPKTILCKNAQGDEICVEW